MPRFAFLFAIVASSSAMLASPLLAQQAATPSKFETLTTGMKKTDGLMNIYTKDQQILVELKQGQLGQDFLMLSSIACGASQGNEALGGNDMG